MSLEECAHCNTSDLNTAGTNSLSGGQALGLGWSTEAVLTLSSMSQVREATKQDGGQHQQGVHPSETDVTEHQA